jgi:hypothetical protein
MRFLWGLLIVLFVTPVARAVDDIPPPFGVRWNDSATHVQALLLGAKAKIVSKETKEGREVWTVEGLVHPGLKRTLFTFQPGPGPYDHERGSVTIPDPKGGRLVEIELQYEYPDWTVERYNSRMGEVRRYFDGKYGTGKLVSRSRDTDTDVIQTLVGYQWMVGSTMLELFYFSAQRGPNLYRTITVDYKLI